MDHLVNLSVLSHVALTKSLNFTGILFKVTCRIKCHKQQTNLCREPTWVRCYISNSDGQFFSWEVQRPFKQSRYINSTKPIHPMVYLEETLAFMTYHSGTSITEENQVVDFKITGSIPVIRLKESQLLQMFWSHLNCSVLLYFIFREFTVLQLQGSVQ